MLRARLERVATAEPSALEYWSFVFSVPSVAMGQPMEYAEYLSVCDGSRFRTGECCAGTRTPAQGLADLDSRRATVCRP